MGPHLNKKLPHSQEPNPMEREPCPAERVRLHGARTATRRAGAHPPCPVPGAFVLSNGRLKGPRGHGKGVTGGTGARASRAGGSGPSGGTRGGPAQAARAGREVPGLAPGPRLSGEAQPAARRGRPPKRAPRSARAARGPAGPGAATPAAPLGPSGVLTLGAPSPSAGRRRAGGGAVNPVPAASGPRAPLTHLMLLHHFAEAGVPLRDPPVKLGDSHLHCQYQLLRAEPEPNARRASAAAAAGGRRSADDNRARGP